MERLINVSEDLKISIQSDPDQQKIRIKNLNTEKSEDLIPGEDYGIIKEMYKKPSLLKPGAEKIQTLLELQSIPVLEDKIIDLVKPVFYYDYNIEIRYSGKLITKGVGSANSMEKEYKNPYAVANTVKKLAKKRAFVDGIISATCLSYLFTQDVEDPNLRKALKLEKDDTKGHGSQGAKKKSAVNTDEKTITSKQNGRLWAKANRDRDLVYSIVGKYGYEDTMQIPVSKYEEIIIALDEALSGSIQPETAQGAGRKLLSPEELRKAVKDNTGKSTLTKQEIQDLYNLAGEAGYNNREEILPGFSIILKRYINFETLKTLPRKDFSFLIEQLNKKIQEKVKPSQEEFLQKKGIIDNIYFPEKDPEIELDFADVISFDEVPF